MALHQCSLGVPKAVSRRPILIVSGGSETITATLVRWARQRSIPVQLFAITVPSLFRDYLPAVEAVECGVGTFEEAGVQLAERINSLVTRFGSPIIALPTDDDSLDLLLQARNEIGDGVRVSRAKALTVGGLSKAELFDRISAAGLHGDIAPTIVVRCEADLVEAKKRWGDAFILKPDRKPWRGSVPGGAKVLSSGEDVSKNIAQIRKDLADGRPWIAQQKLGLLAGAERSACGVYLDGFHCYAEVAELMKYPARGGSAIWVTTNPGSTELRRAAERILSTIEAEGLFEMSFLADEAGRPRLIELNPRPWLQVELLQAAGVDAVGTTIAVLEGTPSSQRTPEPEKRDWINVERFILKIASGDPPGRVASLRALFRAAARFPIVAMWTHVDMEIRTRWMFTLTAKAFRKLSSASTRSRE